MVHSHNKKPLSVVILAAGKSSRFGSSKMLHVLQSGKPILTTTIEQYQKVFNDITVVVKNSNDLIECANKTGVNVVVNEFADQGMSTSIKKGIQATSSARAWLIALADMPYVALSSLRALAEQADDKHIVLPHHKHQQGNPVVFGRFFEPHLLNLDGDVGAKKITLDYPNSRRIVHVDDSGILHDIDTPSDIP